MAGSTDRTTSGDPSTLHQPVSQGLYPSIARSLSRSESLNTNADAALLPISHPTYNSAEATIQPWAPLPSPQAELLTTANLGIRFHFVAADRSFARSS